MFRILKNRIKFIIKHHYSDCSLSTQLAQLYKVFSLMNS